MKAKRNAEGKIESLIFDGESSLDILLNIIKALGTSVWGVADPTPLEWKFFTHTVMYAEEGLVLSSPRVVRRYMDDLELKKRRQVYDIRGELIKKGWLVRTEDNTIELPLLLNPKNLSDTFSIYIKRTHETDR